MAREFVDQSWSEHSPDIVESDLIDKVEYDRPPREILVLIYGTSSPGFWTEQVEFYADAKRSPVLVRRCSYKDVGIPRILWARHARREGKAVYQQLCEIGETFPDCPVSVAAHSWGTRVIADCLAEHPDLRINKLFLIGSLLPQNALLAVRTQIKQIVCDCTPLDKAAIAAHALNWKRFDAAGMFGYSYSGLAIVRRFEGDHSSLTSLSHFTTYIFPALEPDNVVRRPVRSAGARFGRAWMPVFSLLTYSVITLPVLLIALYVFRQ